MSDTLIKDQEMSSSALEDNMEFNPSSSVSDAMRRVGTKERVAAAAFARAIFKSHGEYAGGAAASLQLSDTPLRRKAQEWVDEARTLFDPWKIRSFSKSAEPPKLRQWYLVDPSKSAEQQKLHGRLMVIGLSLLEPRLREQLEG